MKTLICIVSLIAFGAAPAWRVERQATKPSVPIPDPHHHAKGEDLLSELAPEIKIVESSVPPNAELQNLVLNKNKMFSSFTVTTEDGLERIFIRQVLRTNHRDRVYEVIGVAFPNRPLSDSVWAGDYFIFDRSSNPHAAIHYVFDMQKRALVAARAFTE